MPLKYEKFSNAYYYKIPCYYNFETHEVIGRNWFYDILIKIFIVLHVVFVIEDFPIHIVVEKNKDK